MHVCMYVCMRVYVHVCIEGEDELAKEVMALSEYLENHCSDSPVILQMWRRSFKKEHLKNKM